MIFQMPLIPQNITGSNDRRGMVLLDLNNLFGITQCDNWKNGQVVV